MDTPLSTTRKQREIVGIDLLRFFCAFIVMACHLLKNIPAPDSSSIRPYEWTAVFGPTGVETFFVISGFIIPYSAQGKTSFYFIRSRIVRLVPAAWICGTIGFLSLVLSETQATGLLGRYFRTILFVPFVPWHIGSLEDMWVAAPTWTLFVEIGFYTLVLGLIFFKKFEKLPLAATLLGSVTALYWVVIYAAFFLDKDAGWAQMLLRTTWARYLDLTLVHHGAWFGLGINLWLITQQNAGRRYIFSTIVCGLGCALEIPHYSVLGDVKLDLWMQPAICVLAILVLCFSTTERMRKATARGNLPKIARIIGLTTFPLYLVHEPTGFIVATFLNRHGTNLELATWLTLPIMIGLATLIAVYAEPRLQIVFKKSLDFLGDRLENRLIKQKS